MEKAWFFRQAEGKWQWVVDGLRRRTTPLQRGLLVPVIDQRAPERWFTQDRRGRLGELP
jgi:hypothetical protein